MSEIPEGRTVWDVEQESAISLDLMLYGEAFVRGPIPEWWGSLYRYVEGKLAGELGEQQGEHGRRPGNRET